MLRTSLKMLVLVLFTGISGCEPENLSELPLTEATSNLQLIGSKQNNRGRTSPEKGPETENLRDLILMDVAPSECAPTEFSEVIWKHFTAMASDNVALEKMDYYLFLQEQATRLKIGTDYFGPNGEYTRHVEKSVRNLERFWRMPNQIKVLGQHNETLNDRDKLADIIWFSVQDLESREEAYLIADEILQNNSRSSVLRHSPFLSADGLARPNKEIILGDGLVQMFAETGLDEEIVWTGILSHEWAHQVQFDHLTNWYPAGTITDPVELNRAKELEADFFSGYYLTHKRGATFNWKRTEEFFQLFYQSGDCSFEFEQHHGTPLQRERASYEGFLLAEEAKKKGHILSAEKLHEYFQFTVLPNILESSEYF